MNSDEVTLKEIKSMENLAGTYTVTISPRIHEKLEKHVLIQKKLIDRTATKQRWITHAIEEKLVNDANNQQIPKANTLNVRIDEELDKKVLERIEFIKKFRVSYSKKQWLIDAILEKLDRDESKMEKTMLGSQQSQEDIHTQFEQLQTLLTGIKVQLLKDPANNL